MMFCYTSLLRCLCLLMITSVTLSFRPTLLNEQRRTLLELTMAAGMGMAAAQKKSKAGKGKKKGNNSGGNNSSFNVNASLLRLEKKYDEIMRAHTKNILSDDYSSEENDTITTEYVIATRSSGYITDWVPIAQICLARSSSLDDDGISDPLLRAVVSQYCREISHVATIGSRYFQSVPRNSFEYSIETSDSFHRHVYEPIIEKFNVVTENNKSMTKQEARRVLNLSTTTNGSIDDPRDIKQMYRKLSFEWHPDRFASNTDNRSDEEKKHAYEMYAQIKVAYETLSSGIKTKENSSWYESLGGKARTDFIGPIQLMSMTQAIELVQASKVETAVVGLDPDLVQTFVARSRF